MKLFTVILYSTSAEIILAALKELSRLGRTIIMVIHQPRYSIFSSMDNVIFLGPGGKTVYSGNPIDATDYFEMLGFHAPGGVNRADYFMDVSDIYFKNVTRESVCICIYGKSTCSFFFNFYYLPLSFNFCFSLRLSR